MVCTAGFREDGSWIRLYPVPFRKKPYNEQYKKYDWIEVDLVKNESDFRPESFRPKTINTEIKVIGHIGTHDGTWEERKQIRLGKMYYNPTELIAEAKEKNTCTSLAVFKPTQILDFTVEAVEREWDKEKLTKLNQLNLFETTAEGKFEVVQKLPFKFKFHFKDNQGKESHMMIEDWETGQLYWNCLARHEGDESKATADVRHKYIDDFAKTKDLHFFFGTTQAHHHVSLNPFIIIGTFQPNDKIQTKLF